MICLDIQSKLSEIKKRIAKREKVRMKNGEYEYIPTALRLSYNTFSGWLYSVECIEERTNTVVHIKINDLE